MECLFSPRRTVAIRRLASLFMIFIGIWQFVAFPVSPANAAVPHFRSAASPAFPVPLGDFGNLVTATSGSGPSTVTFGIGPQITKAGQQRPFFNYGVTPGAGASDGVEVGNLGLTPISVSVYPSDVVNNSDGTSSLAPGGANPKDVGAWITLPGSSPVTVTVGPRSAVVIPMKISVPFNVQPGDHVGGVIVSLASFAKNAQGDVVRFDQRVATRAFFRVSGALVPKLTIEDLRAVYHQNYSPVGKGSVTVSYTVHNRGNVKVAVGQAVSFTGLFGAKQTALGVPGIPELLPGGFDEVTVLIPNVLPELLGRAHVTLTPTALPGDTDPPLHSVKASKLVFTLPLALIVILLLVALALWLRRRQRKSRGTGGVAPSIESHMVEGDKVNR